MGRKMILTLRRGHDVFSFFSEALAQQVLGLDISTGGGSTGLGGGKGKVDWKKDKGLDITGGGSPVDVDSKMVDKQQGVKVFCNSGGDIGNAKKKTRNRKRRSRRRKSRAEKAASLGTITEDSMVLDVTPIVPPRGNGPHAELDAFWADEVTSSSGPKRLCRSSDDTPKVFTAGDKVTFHGLVSRPELSGVTGTVHSIDSSTGRVAVSVSGVEAIKVMPMNLRMSIFHA